jgi:hypothetical protein
LPHRILSNYTHSIEAARMIAGLNEEKATIYLTSLEKNNLKAKSLTLKDMEDVGDFENSKKAWESITHDRQLKNFKELKEKRKMVESVFPQQVQGCNYGCIT